MAENVDIASLAIEVSADSQNASVDIDKLAESLNKLKSGSLKSFCSSLDSLSASLGTLKTACASIDAIGNLARKMSEMNDVDYDKATIGFKALTNAVARLTSVAPALNAVNFAGLSASMSQLSDALIPIKQIGDESARASAYLINAVAKVPNAAKKLNDVNFEVFKNNVNSLKNSVTPLLGMNYDGLKGLGSALNALSKVPKVSENLKDFDWESFASSCQKAADALTPLASNLNVVAASFAKLPSKLSSVITATNKLSTSNSKAKKSYLSLGSQLDAFKRGMTSFVSLTSIANYIGNAVSSFNDFYEATDLFHNAMGELSDEATGLTDKMEALLGIDPANAMTYMATIQSLGTSFGLASDKAYVLSKNLTQLAYDEGSYWNKNVSETFTAMSSAISGEIEPIRRLGIDLSQARLQQELLSLGFTQQVSSLSQADKAILRYIAIMKQTTNIQGNLAQTINSPANQMKILKAQVEQLSKSVGQLLYPALKSILPVLIAAVELMKEFVSALASLFGQKIEFTDFSQTTSDLGGVTDALDDTTDATKAAAKAAKDYTMGFDELNIIEPQTDSSSGSGSGGASGNILGDVDLSGYDMFANYVGTQIAEVKAKLKELLPIIGAVATAFAAWKITEFLGELGKVLSNLSLIQKATLMVATVVIEWTLVQKNADDFLETGNIFSLIKEWLVTGASAVAGALLFGEKGVTLTLAISAIAQLNSLNYALGNATVGTVDKEYWMQLISASVTGGLAGLVLTHSATGFVVTASLIAALELTQTAYFESKSGTLEIGGVMNQILALLAGTATGVAGVAIALAAGAAAPVAGAALVASFGLGVVLEQVGVSMGSYNRIDEIRQYIADYESKGFNELSISMRLKNLGFSDEEIALAENEAITQFDIFKHDMGELISGVIESVNNYWEEESLLHGAIEQAKIGAGQLKESVDTICDNFVGWCSSIQDNAAEAGKATAEWFNSIRDTASKKAEEVKEKLKEGFSNAASAISSKYSELKSSVSTWADGIKDGLADKVESVKQKAAEIADSVKSKLSELNLFDVGKNLIQGFINGINNMVENVKKTASNLADSTVNKLKEVLGIHSPSTVAAEMGNYFDQGLANGLAEGTKVVSNAAYSLATITVDAFKQGFSSESDGMYSLGEQAGKNVDQGIADGVTAAQGVVDTALKGLINAAQTTGNSFVDKGVELGSNFVDSLDQTLTSKWNTLNSNLQNDFFGTIQTLYNAAQSGDVATIGTTIASVIWQAMGDEQRTRIKTVAKNMISDLGSQFQNALSVLSEQAYNIGSEIFSGITSNFGNILTSAMNLGSSLSTAFSSLKAPLASAATAISTAMSSGLASSFPAIFASMGSLISTVGAAFVGLLQSIGAALDATGFGIPAGLLVAAAGIALAAAIAGIVSSLGGGSSSSVSSSSAGTSLSSSTSGSGGYDIDYSSVAGTSQYSGSSASSTGSYVSGSVQQLSTSEIRDAVYNGAYNALLDYKQRYASESQNNILKLYIDGKQITASVEKTQNERGRSIMGTEAYSY